jgi:putative lipoic acid-binding regulatory protein
MQEEGRSKLKERLDEVHEWPSVYMFKFILEPDEGVIAQLEALFPEEAEILRKYSKTGKFVSLSIKEVMMSSDEVLERYERASAIEGVMML